MSLPKYEILSATQLNGNSDKLRTTFLWSGVDKKIENNALSISVKGVKTLKEGIQIADHSKNVDELADTLTKIRQSEGAYSIDPFLDTVFFAESADEAVRVLVYKNGEQAMYGKAKYTDRNTAETDCTMFETDSRVMTTSTEGFEVDQVDKYTIVIWAEGNDPECIDDIRGGHVRMRMLFEVRDDENDEKPFGAGIFN